MAYRILVSAPVPLGLIRVLNLVGLGWGLGQGALGTKGLGIMVMNMMAYPISFLSLSTLMVAYVNLVSAPVPLGLIRFLNLVVLGWVGIGFEI